MGDNTYGKRSFTIYAVDFDGTLCSDRWPQIGEPNNNLIDFLIHQQKMGEKVILWTCRSSDLLEKAVKWCKRRGLIFDAVNDNLPGLVAAYGNNSRKVFADVYIDDKNFMYSKQFSVPFVID